MSELPVHNTVKFSYTMSDAAGSMINPLINTRPKLFQFLRRFGIIEGMNPRPELIAQDYFTIIDYKLPKANGGRMVRKILVSQKGVDFIKKLSKLIYGL
jgi:hypothetical protein